MHPEGLAELPRKGDLQDQEQRSKHDCKITLSSIGSEGLRNQRRRAVARTRLGRNMEFGSDFVLESTKWQKRFHELIAIGVKKSDCPGTTGLKG